MCKINDRLARYKQMRDEFPAENFLNVCIARYEINMIKYDINNGSKYLAILNMLENLMDQFYELALKRRAEHQMDTYIKIF
jgi:hypothetical protein